MKVTEENVCDDKKKQQLRYESVEHRERLNQLAAIVINNV